MPEARQTFQLIANRGDASTRLDRVLAQRVTIVSRLSRSMAQRWIESGNVTVDGRAARRASMHVREGASISVELPPSTVVKLRPRGEPGTLSILYEDDVVMVVDKPAGTVVHPSYKRASGTLLNAVLWHLGGGQDVRPGIVTRLDKDTTGLVLIAKTGASHAALQRAAAASRIRKEYLAIVRGCPRPAHGRMQDPLGRDPMDRRRVIVSPDGAASETRYEVLDTGCQHPVSFSLVRCELVTGRTHQIRVHLAAHGWPVVGDRTYGIADARIGRQALHAWRLSLPHPATRALIEVESPLPEDMRVLLGESEVARAMSDDAEASAFAEASADRQRHRGNHGT